jgi:hypothetical protein
MRNTLESRRRAYVLGRPFARAAAVLVLMVVALVAGACNVLTDFGNYVAGGTFCSSFTDVRTGSQFAVAASFYGCNIPGVDGPLPYPSTVGNYPIPVCGAGFCALSTGDAEAQAIAQLGYPSGTMVGGLQCFFLGNDLATANPVAKGLLASWPPSLCVSPATDGACDPCDDGQGGTLQSLGEDCGDSSMCCEGLMCVGASASIMGTCVGTQQQCANTKSECLDMFDACQDKGGTCTQLILDSLDYCGVCRDDCQANKPYTYSKCYQCGFQ